MSRPIDDVLAWVTACNCNAPDPDGLNLLLDKVPLVWQALRANRDRLAACSGREA